MAVSEKEARLIYEQSQICLSELNRALSKIESGVNEQDFNEMRLSFAEMMGTLVDVCEVYVYKDFPDLRPYSIKKSTP